MHEDFKNDRLRVAFHTASQLFQSGVTSPARSVRAVLLDCRSTNMDLMRGMAHAIQESIEQAFGAGSAEDSADCGQERQLRMNL